MNGKQVEKLILLNRKLIKNGWLVYGNSYKMLYRDHQRNLQVSINTYNGYIDYTNPKCSGALQLQETLIFYKIAKIYREDLESKIGKRL